MEYYWALKRKEGMTHAATRMNFKKRAEWRKADTKNHTVHNFVKRTKLQTHKGEKQISDS